MPLRGLIGSDVLAHRPDWRVIDNPFGADDPIVLLPAIRPDVALFHAPLADRAGNVWVGTQRELVTMAHAAGKRSSRSKRCTTATCWPTARSRPARCPASTSRAVAVAPRGAWPLPLPDHYAWDAAHLAEYARLAATPEGFAAYLEAHVHERRAA